MGKEIYIQRVLTHLDEVAQTDPMKLGLYITEYISLMRVSDFGFTENDINKFTLQTEEIIDRHNNGVLFTELM